MSTVREGTGVMPAPVMQELGDGFYAYVQLDGSWGLNNCGLFVGDGGPMLIDTAFTEPRARALSEAVRRLTDRPVEVLVNTHHHGDHTHGNAAFQGTAVIGHERCRDAMLRAGLEVTHWFPGVEWGEISVRPPFVTFEGRLTLHCDTHRAELRAMGPAHTDNDIVVWVEDRGLLFAGDLIFNGGTPFVLMGSVAGTLSALEDLKDLQATTIVPGHGPVCGPEVIQDQIDYLSFVQEVARSSFEESVPPLAAALDTDLGGFADWTDRERLVGNLHRAHSELRDEPPGVPLDYHQIVDEMVAYNGGRPLTCYA